MQLIERAITSLKRVSDWVWPVKFLVGAALGALAGGGLLSFLLETATHSYAISYGFRPPVEGLPYLRTLVSSGSVILLIAASIVATLVIGLLGGFVRFMARIPSPKERFDPTTTPLWKAMLISIAYSLFVAGVLYLSQRYNLPESKERPYCMWPLISCDPDPTDVVEIVLLSLILNLPLALVFFRPALSWVAAASFIVWYYFGLGANILPPDGYARLLRSTGFGGGVSVSVDFLAGDSGCINESFSGNLLLRTTETLILYDATCGKIAEVTARCVQRITYTSGGLSNLPHKLPPKNMLFVNRRNAA
jgi:hypothetical protein